MIALARSLPLLALLACDASNDPPRYFSVNGLQVRYLVGVPYLRDTLFVPLGGRLEIEVEARDPEGEPLEFWWPEAPPGFSSDPAQPRASWEVPSDTWLGFFDLSLIALDGADPPASETLLIPVLVTAAEGDTGLAR